MHEKLIEARTLIRDVQDVLITASHKTEGDVRHNLILARGRLDAALILTDRLPEAAPGLTAAQMADSLDHFGNDAITAMHRGTADVACIAQGLAAVAMRLAEIGKEEVEDRGGFSCILCRGDQEPCPACRQANAEAGPVGEAMATSRSELQEVCDLLAERKYGSPARSPAHNARLVIERILARPVEKPGEVERACDCDPEACKDHIEALLQRALNAEAALAVTRERLEKVEELRREIGEPRVIQEIMCALVLRRNRTRFTRDEPHTRYVTNLVERFATRTRAALTGDAQEAGR